MKKIILVFLVISFVFWGVSCGFEKKEETEDSSAISVIVSADSKTISIGEKIEFKVKIENSPKAKSVGLELQYDKTCFDLVDGEMGINGDLSDFSDGIGVVAFSQPTDVNKTILIFTLKAKAVSSSESVRCKISIKDQDDKSVDIATDNIVPAYITIN